MKKILVIQICALFWFCSSSARKLENFNAGNPPADEAAYAQYTDFIFQASRHYDNNQCSDAIKSADEALKFYSEGAKAWQIKGLCYLNEKNFPEAISAFEKSDRYETDNEKTLLGLALATQNHDNKKNLMVVTRLTQLKPQNASYQFALGISFRLNKQPEKAIDAFHGALSKKYTPASAAHLQLGELYAETGNSAKSLENFEAAGKAAPENEHISGKTHEARYQKYMKEGKQLAEQKKYSEAANAFNSAAGEKETQEALLSAGLMLYQASRYSEAAEPLKKCTTLFKQNEEAWTFLITTYLKAREIEQARVTAREAMRLFPDSYAILFEAGKLEEESGDTAKALETYRTAAQKKSARVEVFARIITLSFETGQQRRAELAYNEAINRFVASAEDKKLISELYEFLRFESLARKYFSEGNITQLGSTLKKAEKFAAYPAHKLYRAGFCSLRYGKEAEHTNTLFTECEKLYTELRKAEPDNQLAYNHYERFLLLVEKKAGSNKQSIKAKLAALRNQPPATSANKAEAVLMAQGLRLENEGNFAKAIEHYERSLKKNPKSENIRRRLFYSFLKYAVQKENNREKGVEALLKKAETLYAKDPTLAETQAVINENRALSKHAEEASNAERAERTGDYETAYNIWKKIHEKTGNPRTGYRVWKSLYRSGANASAQLQKLDQQFDNKGRWTFYRARVALDTGSHAEALTLVEKALDKNAEDAEAWFQAGIIFLGSNKPQQAQTAFLRSLDINSLFSPSWVGLGVSFFAQRDTRSGRMAFTRALEISQKETLASINLVVSEINESKYAEAEARLTGLEKIPSAKADVNYYQGFIHYLRKEYDKAITHLKAAVKTEPREEFLYGLYNAQTKVGDNAGAAESVRQLVSKFPDGGYTRLLLSKKDQKLAVKEGFVTAGGLQIPGGGYLRKGTLFALQNNLLFYYSNLSIRAYDLTSKKIIWTKRLSASPTFLSARGVLLVNLGNTAIMVDVNTGDTIHETKLSHKANGKLYAAGKNSPYLVGQNKDSSMHIWDLQGNVLYQADKVSSMAVQGITVFSKDKKIHVLQECSPEPENCTPQTLSDSFSEKLKLQISADAGMVLASSALGIMVVSLPGGANEFKVVKNLKVSGFWQSGFFTCGYFAAGKERITLTNYCEDKTRIALTPAELNTESASLIADSQDSFRILYADKSYYYASGKYNKETFLPAHKKDASLIILRHLSK